MSRKGKSQEQGLPNRQQLFVDFYLQTWSATAAAKQAGYSEATAYSQGQRLLKKVEVQTIIKERISQGAMSADEVLSRLALQARFDPGPFFVFDDEGEFMGIDLQRVRDAGLSHLIKSVSQTRVGGWRIEWADSLAALQLIGKHLGLFKEQVEHSGPNGGPIVIAPATTEQSSKELAEWRREQQRLIETQLNGPIA